MTVLLPNVLSCGGILFAPYNLLRFSWTVHGQEIQEHFYQAGRDSDYKHRLLDLLQGGELLLKATLIRLKMCGDRRPTEQELYRGVSVNLAELRRLVSTDYPDGLNQLNTLALEATRSSTSPFCSRMMPS
ncbi:hypothetical protein ACTVKO_23850 [Serratia nevei]|uniref:hypothetical protein n=1 Tax=Serratia nevei TaxID=2703794 RepID=UPI003FA6DF63